MGRRAAYQQYLKSERWSALKAEAISLAGGRCRVCNGGEGLAVHHREYPRILGEESQDMLTVLCEECHNLFHARTGSKRCSGKTNENVKRLRSRAARGDIGAKSKLKKISQSSVVRHFTEEEIAAYEESLGGRHG